MKIRNLAFVATCLMLCAFGGATSGAQAQDSAGLSVKIDRMENQLRAMTGLIEQMQFQQKRLEEQLRKSQADADFRFQELGAKPGPAAKLGATGEAPRQPALAALPSASPTPGAVAAPAGGAPAALPPLAAGAAQALPGQSPRKTLRPSAGGDAFDPAAQPNAPGVPRTLGGATTALPGPATVLPGGPISLENEPDPLNQPVELGQPGQNRGPVNSRIEPLNPGAAPLTPPGAIPTVAAPPALPTAPTVTAALPPAAPRDDYQTALASLKSGQYDAAEQSLRGFIQKNPRSSRLPDATYYLGETYFQRGRHREAAEQYLKLSTDYSGSTRAPEGLLRLGLSLKALGAGEQACATFGEVARKYPNAPIAVRKGAEREIQRAKCS